MRRIGARPDELVAADRAAMGPLPPIAPAVGLATSGRLGRDYYLAVAGNDYSIDPNMIGRVETVHADLRRVTARVGDLLVAEHARHWGRRVTITDPAHVTAAARLRKEFQNPPPRPAPGDGMTRPLRVYDDAFGLDGFEDGRDWLADTGYGLETPLSVAVSA